jgi:type I restriction enzyme R subunit
MLTNATRNPAVRWNGSTKILPMVRNQLDKACHGPDLQSSAIRINSYRDLPVDEVPKTLIFAKDDSHAEDIVRSCERVFKETNSLRKSL